MFGTIRRTLANICNGNSSVQEQCGTTCALIDLGEALQTVEPLDAAPSPSWLAAACYVEQVSPDKLPLSCKEREVLDQELAALAHKAPLEVYTLCLETISVRESGARGSLIAVTEGVNAPSE